MSNACVASVSDWDVKEFWRSITCTATLPAIPPIAAPSAKVVDDATRQTRELSVFRYSANEPWSGVRFPWTKPATLSPTLNCAPAPPSKACSTVPAKSQPMSAPECASSAFCTSRSACYRNIQILKGSYFPVRRIDGDGAHFDEELAWRIQRWDWLGADCDTLRRNPGCYDRPHTTEAFRGESHVKRAERRAA